jgi:hypothetical protein
MIARVRLATRAALAILATVAVTLVATAAHAEHAAGHADIPRTARPLDAKLYIISPQDGETVTSPVTVRFGLAGMGVAPAGVASPNTGHHHLIIDSPTPDADHPLPKDDKHIHYGGGQTEASIPLTPGKHTLRLVLGDKDHVIFEPPLVSQEITITVK